MPFWYQDILPSSKSRHTPTKSPSFQIRPAGFLDWVCDLSFPHMTCLYPSYPQLKLSSPIPCALSSVGSKAMEAQPEPWVKAYLHLTNLHQRGRSKVSLVVPLARIYCPSVVSKRNNVLTHSLEMLESTILCHCSAPTVSLHPSFVVFQGFRGRAIALSDFPRILSCTAISMS